MPTLFIVLQISERRTDYSDPSSPHAAEYARMLAALNRNEAAGTSAERVAATIVKAVEARHPKPLYAVGSNAPLAFAARRILPASAMARLTHRRHDLKR